MKRRYSYIDCYKILNIEPGCSWDELRKAYKIQIQKWHPDRFPEQSPEKLAADDKIKRITSANQQLVAYYRKHGRLPDPESENTPSALPRPNRPTHYSSHSASAQASQINETIRSRPSLLPIVILIAIISFLVWHYTPYTHTRMPAPVVKTPEPQRYEPVKKLPSNPMLISSTSASDSAASSTTSSLKPETEEFISYGSTVGAVIAIQGAPTSQIGDTWFYGESEIYFMDGRVIGWRHMPGSALKISVENSEIGKTR